MAACQQRLRLLMAFSLQSARRMHNCSAWSSFSGVLGFSVFLGRFLDRMTRWKDRTGHAAASSLAWCARGTKDLARRWWQLGACKVYNSPCNARSRPYLPSAPISLRHADLDDGSLVSTATLRQSQSTQTCCRQGCLSPHPQKNRRHQHHENCGSKRDPHCGGVRDGTNMQCTNV